MSMAHLVDNKTMNDRQFFASVFYSWAPMNGTIWQWRIMLSSASSCLCDSSFIFVVQCRLYKLEFQIEKLNSISKHRFRGFFLFSTIIEFPFEKGESLFKPSIP